MSQILQTELPVSEDVVSVAVPAAGGWLGVLRTATAGLAARMGFSAEQIEDLRIAVDEACAMLLPIAAKGAELHCRYDCAGPALTVEVSAPLRAGATLPGPSAFSWQVLAGLVKQVEPDSQPDRAVIRLVTEAP